MNEKLKDFQKKFHSADWWYQDAFDEDYANKKLVLPDGLDEILNERMEQVKKMAKAK